MDFKTILFLFIGSLPLALSAQLTTGMVHYDETIHLDIDLPEEDRQFAHLIPSEQTNPFILRFTPEATHYAPDNSVEEEPPPPPTEGEVNFQIKIMRSSDNSATYTNLAEGTMLEQRSIFGRPFRIEHEELATEWRLSTEQKDILGYTCIKATSGPDSLLTTAWFAPQIPVSSGPGTFGQLPGLILEVNRDNMTITATSISEELDDENLIAPPSKGRKVTEEQFDAIQAEKMEEMDLQGGRRIEIRG